MNWQTMSYDCTGAQGLSDGSMTSIAAGDYSIVNHSMINHSSAIQANQKCQQQPAKIQCVFHVITQIVGNHLGQVRLRAKLWQLLDALARRQGQLVTREWMIDALWQGNYYTGPNALTHAICHLRQALKPLGLSEFLITVPKRGYVLMKLCDCRWLESQVSHRSDLGNDLEAAFKLQYGQDQPFALMTRL